MTRKQSYVQTQASEPGENDNPMTERPFISEADEETPQRNLALQNKTKFKLEIPDKFDGNENQDSLVNDSPLKLESGLAPEEQEEPQPKPEQI